MATRVQIPSSLPPAEYDGPDGFEPPVPGGSAGGQQSPAHLGIRIQLPMSLHGLHQVGQRRLQTLSADPVGCFPNQDYRLADRLGVDAPAPDPRQLFFCGAGLCQQPDVVLAMVSADRAEFVQDPALVLPGRGFGAGLVVPVSWYRSRGTGLVLLPTTPVLPSCQCLPPRDRLPNFR